MADEQIVTNIVATSDFSSLIADVQRTSVALSKLQSQLTLSNTALASQAGQIQKGFGETLRSTGQFTSHFVTVGSEVDRFGKSLDSGRLKLRDYFKVYQDHTKTSSGLIRGLAKEQVALQQSIVQSLGKSADGMQKFNVHVKTGLDEVANKTALAKKEMQIYNKVIQDGGNQIINWGKNTQWAGRQLTVGLTVPIVAFGVAASKAFRDADQELVRLTKVYGGLAATSKEELAQVRRDVAATAKELAAAYGASYKDTISLAADIAATGKQGNELLNSTREATRLSILGEVDRQEAMKATLAIQSAFKQNTDQLTESINFLNAVENQTSTSLADLVEAIPKAGPVVKALGGDVEDLALYLTAMREGGINASEGANALKSALASIINPTKVAREQFMGFGIDLSGIVNKNAGNLTGTILEIQAALETLDPLKKSQAIEQLFGKFQFARMNALFENLGKQGSQTLQVLDLMKASSQDLASVAGRELGQITESASGKYRRALESLKAELAKVGEQFLTVQTFFVNLVDKILKFVGNLPDPIKKVLTLLAGFTAVAGPLIMLTGVFANFFGYIIKGVGHLRALFKGGEGFKLLTPQIVAANQAGSLIEKTFYSDAKAATTLAAALSNLNNEFNLLYNKANNVMPVSPAISTMANSIIMPGGDRVVNKQSQFLGKPYSRDMSHMVPSKTPQAGSIFGVLPGTAPVNKRISNNPQIYASGDLPDVPGLTSVNNVSTGVVAAQAAKWHSMTAAIAMQSDVDLAALRQEVAATGTITSELSTSYQALLPKMNEVIQKAVKQSELIVMEAKAGKISLEQSKARIVALNAEIEALLASTAQGVAAAQGKVINVGMVPLTSQMAVDPKTGKSNMKEMFHKSSNANLINKIAGVLGVRTSGGGYSTQTTKPRQLNDGGKVFYNDGDQVPGPNVNADVVPAMLTPGEFVIRRDIAQQDPDGMRALNSGQATIVPVQRNMGGVIPEYITGGQIRALQSLPTEFLRRINLISGVRRADTRSGRQVFSSGALNYDQMGSRPGRNSIWNNPILAAGRPGPDEVAGHIYSNNFYSKFGKSSSGSSPRATAEEFSLLTGLNIPKSRTNYAGQYDILPNQFVTLPESFNTKLTPKIIRGKNVAPSATKMDWFANPRRPEHMLSLVEMLTSQGIPPRRALGIAQQALNRINSNIARLPDNAVITERIFGNIVTNSTRAEMRLLASRGNLAQSQQEMSARSLPRGRAASGPLASLPKRNRGGMINRYNMGGKVRGYKFGDIVKGYSGLRGWVRGKGTLGKSPQLDESGNPVIDPSSGMATSMAGMGLMMGGQMVPGMAGQGMTFAGMAMQMAPMLKMLTPMIKGMGTFAGILLKVKTVGTAVFTALRIGMAAILGPVGLISAAIAGAVTLFLKLKKDATDAGEVNRATFGLTGTALEEVGIKYKTVGERIKEVNQQLELNKAKVEASYQSYTKSGVAGLDITLKALNDGIANAKKEDTESVGLFDKAKSGQVNQLAASMKAQYVSLGMSVQEATNQIYILIKASNKSSQALAAISSDSFKSISDAATAAMYSVKALSNVLSTEGAFNAEEFSRGLDNMLNSLVEYRKSLMETNKTQIGLTNLEASQEVLERINKLGKDKTKIEGDNLTALKQQDMTMALILGKSETLASVYAKYELYLSGASAEMDIMAMSAEQAVLALQGYEISKMAAGTILKGSTISNTALEAKNASDTAEKILKKAQNQDDSYINTAIKNKEKLIRKLEEERSARLKILELQEKSQNFETQIQQAQLRYADAIAAGDMSQAAREQLNIQKLVADKERDNARQSINDKADKERKKLELEIEKLQAQKDKQAKDLANAQATAAKKQEKATAAAGFMARIQKAIAEFGGDKIDDDKQFEALLSDMRKEGLGEEVNDLLSRYENTKTNSLGYQTGSSVYGSVLRELKARTNTELKDNPNYDKFETAVETFQAAVDQFAGESDGKAKPSGVSGETSGTGKKGDPIKYKNKEGKPITKEEYESQPVGAGKGKQEFVIPDPELSNRTYANFMMPGAALRTRHPKGLEKDGLKYQPNGTVMQGRETVGRWWAGLPNGSGQVKSYSNGGSIKHYNPGGTVSGPGTGTSDSIPAYLSNGEYVIKAAAVEQYGVPFFDAANAQKLAGGGKAKRKKNNTIYINPEYQDSDEYGDYQFDTTKYPITKNQMVNLKAALSYMKKETGVNFKIVGNNASQDLLKKAINIRMYNKLSNSMRAGYSDGQSVHIGNVDTLNRFSLGRSGSTKTIAHELLHHMGRDHDCDDYKPGGGHTKNPFDLMFPVGLPFQNMSKDSANIVKKYAQKFSTGGMPNPFGMGMEWFGKTLSNAGNSVIKNLLGFDTTTPFSKKSKMELLSMALLPMGGGGMGGAKLTGQTAAKISAKVEALKFMSQGLHNSKNPNLVNDLVNPLNYPHSSFNALGDFTHFSTSAKYQAHAPERYGPNAFKPKLNTKSVIAILKSKGFASPKDMVSYGYPYGVSGARYADEGIQKAIKDGFIGMKYGQNKGDVTAEQFASFFTGFPKHPLGNITKANPNQASGLMKSLFAIPNKINQIRNQAKVNSMVKNGMWHGSQPLGHRGEDYLQGKNILDGAETHDPFYGMGFFGTSSKSEADLYASGYNSLNNWGESFGSLNQITKAPKGKYVDFTKGTNSLKWQNYELAKALGVKKNEYLGKYMQENLGDIMNSKGMTGAIMNRVNAGRVPTDIQNAKWLAWNNPTGVHTIQRAMGGIVGPNYNVPSKTTSVANMPFGRYNQGGMVNNYGGFNIHANPGMDEKMLAKYVMAEIRTENAKSFASQGRPGARLMS